jgi:CDP-glucose 4,6-dehydratase
MVRTVFSGVYGGKRVVVTGDTGFKGSWLTVWLQQLGAEVIGIANGIPTSPSMFATLGLEKLIDHHVLDVRDHQSLSTLIKRIQPEFVFHLAAQALVFDAYADPCSTFATNALGTANVLDALRGADFPCTAVMITSDKCYENLEWTWGYRENDRLGGGDPYSASKACAELVISSFVRSFFSAPQSSVRVATARAGNVIGGGDWSANRIVPDCMRAWTTGKAVELRRPQSTRPWQHVLEPLSGYLRLGEKLSQDSGLHGESFNFGPQAHQNYSVEELIRALAEQWFRSDPGFEAMIMRPDHSLPEAGLLKLCCDKALSRLGWESVLDFSPTARLTSEWYAQFYSTNSADMLAFTTSQILDFTVQAGRKNLPWANA